MKNQNKKIVVETTIDFDGYIDYYSGHGHAFASDDLIACLQFSVPINYTETVNEIIQGIIEDLNQEAYPVNEKLFSEYETEIEALTDKDFEASIRAQLTDGTKDTDKFFDVDQEEIYDQNDDMVELPSLVGHVHILKA